jgi:hypothetical protein
VHSQQIGAGHKNDYFRSQKNVPHDALSRAEQEIKIWHALLVVQNACKMLRVSIKKGRERGAKSSNNLHTDSNFI